ncbi:MAG: glycosyltransferase family 39 protein [Deltaproteobacteria bacterium]|nr:glycosyltransferase family 39 protein [Deltaproteobacteria bacterium]
MSPSRRRVWLALILVVGATLRAYRIDWGLPDFVFLDTYLFVSRPAWQLLVHGDWLPEKMIHPPALAYLVAGGTLAWTKLTGASVPPATDLSLFDLVGRILTVLFSTATIAALYALARRSIGTYGALIAAAALALTPVHVLEAHRPHTDALMILVSLLAAHQALVARDEGSTARLLVSFALIGLAGGVKYTGLAAGSLQAWIALTWDGRSWSARFALLLSGCAVVLAAFLVVILPILVQWDELVRTGKVIFSAGMVTGAPGENLQGEGWVFVRYVYPLVVALPFVMGWTIYLSGLAGLLLVARAPRVRGPVLAAVVPFFLLQGAAQTVTPRYFLPLVPWLCLGCGYAMAQLRQRRPPLGLATTLVVLGYTAILTVSHCLRIQDGPQRAAASAIQAEVERVRADGRELRLAYPVRLQLAYDTLKPLLGPDVDLVFFPIGWGRRASDDPHDRSGRFARWLDEENVDAVLVTSWREGIARRGGLSRADAAFLDRLDDGSLGFELALDTRTRFFTQDLYTWADPVFETFVPAGIMGYELYVRRRDSRLEGLPAAAGRSSPEPAAAPLRTPRAASRRSERGR